MRIYNWSDVEQETSISKHRIKYALERGRIGGIAKLRGGYVFTSEDIEMIKAYFSGRGPWKRAIDETKGNDPGSAIQ